MIPNTDITQHNCQTSLDLDYLRCLRSIKLSSVLSCIILLSACGSYSTKQDTTTALDKEAYLAIPDTWTIHAKLGIKNADDSGSVTLNWKQIGDTYTIQLRGPFGQGNAKLSGNRHAILIEQLGKIPLYSSDPNNLILQTFGWDLPLQHLPYWIRGLQHPHDHTDKSSVDTGESQTSSQAIANTQHDEAGMLSNLSQSGWDINYSRYNVRQQYLAPHKIRASNNDVILTLVIKQWGFPNNSEADKKMATNKMIPQ